MCEIDDDGEVWDFCRMTMRQARKLHRCGECRRPIDPGEKYRYLTGKFDGEIQTIRQCAHCAIAADLLVRECGGYPIGGVQDEMFAHVDWDVPWRMRAARNAIAMSRRWMRFDGAGLMVVPVLR